MHIGVELMGVGLVGLYALFANVGDGDWLGSGRTAIFVYGGGVGMIFIPLFDIILSGVQDHEAGTT